MMSKKAKEAPVDSADDSPRFLPERRYRPFRLTLHSLKLIDLLARKENMNRTTIVEVAIREMAKDRQVSL